MTADESAEAALEKFDGHHDFELADEEQAGEFAFCIPGMTGTEGSGKEILEEPLGVNPLLHYLSGTGAEKDAGGDVTDVGKDVDLFLVVVADAGTVVKIVGTVAAWWTVVDVADWTVVDDVHDYSHLQPGHTWMYDCPQEIETSLVRKTWACC